MTELKPYPEYKDSGVEWIGEIPVDWDTHKIKYVANLISGHSFNSDDYTDSGIPIIRIGDVEQEIDWKSTKKVDINDLTKYEKFLIKKDDILIAMTGATIGKTSTYNYDKISLLNQRVGIIRAKKWIDKNYLAFLINSFIFKKQIQYLSYGGAQDNIGLTDMGNMFLSFPQKNKQKIIAQYLNEKTADIDRIIIYKEQLIKLLEEKRQAIITETVTKGLDPNVKMKDSGIEWIGEIPEHWNVIKLKRYLKVHNGREIENELDFDNEVAINVYGSGGVFKKTDKYLYHGESVLFGRKGTIGKPLYVNEKFWTVDTMYFTTFYDNAYPKYFYYILKTFPWELHTTQTALPSIVGTEIENEYFVAPPYNEQILLSEMLDKKLNHINKLNTFVNKQIDKLKEYRESLIYEAVTGKIDLRDYEVDSSEYDTYEKVAESGGTYND